MFAEHADGQIIRNNLKCDCSLNSEHTVQWTVLLLQRRKRERAKDVRRFCTNLNSALWIPQESKPFKAPVALLNCFYEFAQGGQFAISPVMAMSIESTSIERVTLWVTVRFTLWVAVASDLGQMAHSHGAREDRCRTERTNSVLVN